MDDLVDSLTFNFSVGDVDGISVNAPHPRFGQYKSNSYVTNSQTKRRSEWLDRHKSKREEIINRARNLVVSAGSNDAGEVMEVDCRGERRARPFKKYKDQLMLSEWLVDVPLDFEENWLMMPCPEGKRCLVVAAGGSTDAYAKGGHCLKTFPSVLPGGQTEHGSTLLDCVFSQVDKTFYVLDLLSWGSSHNYTECETDFRLFWTQSKILESPDLAKMSRHNKYKFVPLPYTPCTNDSMAAMMKTDMNLSQAKLDGLLFYHKEILYEPGPTPLIGWLKPFMLPEILGVPIPASFMPETGIVCAAEFREDFSKKEDEKRHKNKKISDRSCPADATAKTGMEIEMESSLPTAGSNGLDDFGAKDICDKASNLNETSKLDE